MQGNIEKTAQNVENYRKNTIFYKSARQGFCEILNFLKKKYEDFTLLIPGFIGYSPREGSGIYDPIVENNINHVFYPINKDINIEVKKFEEQIEKIKNKVVVLLVHYYGYTDINIDQIVEISNKKDAFIIEDCAHGLYTDYVDNCCGQYSDVSIYSLHKMLPYKEGGMVRLNTNNIELQNTKYFYNILEYDLKEISNKRKDNANIIENQLKGLKGVKILRPTQIYKNQTPQTYPILIENYDKNEIYHRLNEYGYGVVSLYHTMIEKLKTPEHKIANEISNKILNLPVHQDADKKEIIDMCKLLKTIIGD